ncbi:MAG: bifunctional glutamate N-acetyltransferase/amino-acid acetyltransferase ArgJ [Planctomycetes bacterium]|nr:bifunctional glutamate N-acetyltransferase/amino-acid acetyltransferase ArgJ [Planctomycetota bacterium]
MHLPQAFRFTGVHCGIRPDGDRRDLALVVSDRPARAAGVFTQNRVCAAPVQVCRQRLPREDARGIVICSGNANACTGERGLADARRMTEIAAKSLGCKAEQMLVCSTGVIGRFLPMDKVEPGITDAVAHLGEGPAHLDKAAHAILTTDTRVKISSRTLLLDGRDVSITGFAKGAAMIGPNMATLLAFVLTDASVTKDDLARLAPVAAERSFNSMSVEGHTSTNDSLIFLANGAGPTLRGESLAAFDEAAIAVCADLARAIAADAEGASHLITIEVEGTRTEVEARRIAKAIAESALVKTAFFGADPNWGRIVSAAGYAGVEFEERQLSLWLGDFLLYEHGTPLPFDAAAVSAFMQQNRELTVRLVFMLGKARCTFHTCDLTYDYVRLNAEYTT